jgi:hypothetical protein
MECPRELPPGQCCGITATGATYVQHVLACQRDVLSKRVDIRKGGGQTGMATSKPINIRKVAWNLVHQKKANYRREHPEATDAEATVKVFEASPQLYDLYVDGIRRGDPSELYPEEPIAKAAPSAQAAVYDRAVVMAKDKVSKGLAKTEADALADVWRDNPSLYEAYRQSFARGGSS